MAGSSGTICPVWNITCDTTTRSVPGAIAAMMSSAAKSPSARGSTNASEMRPRRAYSRRITSSESNSPRVATTRGDAIVGVQHRAQALPRARLRHDAVGARRAEQRARAARGTPPSRPPTRPTRRPAARTTARAPRARRRRSRRAGARASGWRDRCGRAARRARGRRAARCARARRLRSAARGRARRRLLDAPASGCAVIDFGLRRRSPCARRSARERTCARARA